MAVTKDLGKIMTIPRGAYSNVTSYEFLDEVTSEGSTYRYINSTPGAGHPLTDTTYWECIAHKGADGVTPTIDPQPTSGSSNAVSSGGVYTALADKVDNSKIGSANGVAGLDSTGKVPSAQLPSYVDDVLEYASQSAFPATGETGKIYIALDTNKIFRWSGSAYVEISESLALGETSSTAYAGNKGKANADAISAMKDGSSIDSFGDVETALAEKVDKVSGKGLSTNDYDNTAKGIVDNIQSNVIANTKLIKDTVGWSGKNLLEINSIDLNGTYAGIVYKKNADGTITAVSGTSTQNGQAYIATNFTFKGGVHYKLTGMPDIAEEYASVVWIGVYREAGGGQSSNYDFTLTADKGEVDVYYETDTVRNIRLRMITGYTIPSGGLVFKPMLRYATFLNSDFEPYRGTTAFPRDEQRVLGAKNILPNPNPVGSSTHAELTVTTNADGTITIGAGTTGSSNDGSYHFTEGMVFSKGNYILSGIPSNLDKTGMIIEVKTGSFSGTKIADIGYNKPQAIINLENDTALYIRMYIYKDITWSSDLVWKPMIRLASDPDDTYAPYAMTNRELTDAVQSIINAVTNAADFAAFKTAIGNL